MRGSIFLVGVFIATAMALPSHSVDLAPVASNNGTEFCLNHETSDGKKCYQGCADKQFAAKGLDQKGKCGVHYNTVDSTSTQKQCPDGVTNLKYCKGSEVEVTFTSKGKAGDCFHNEEASGKRCYEACAFSKFHMKDFDTPGFCPDKYNFQQSVHKAQQCPDGVTNVKYCPNSVVTVIVRTIGVNTPTEMTTASLTNVANITSSLPDGVNCKTDADCPCSYCKNDKTKTAPYLCQAAKPGICCKTDADCKVNDPASYCETYKPASGTKSLPWRCHGN
jgi:hypothetical protein